jgi:predicted Zn finger-like uncharacterized protein
MPEIVQCPNCDKKLRVPDNLLGKGVKCPGCGKTFSAKAAAGSAADEVQTKPASRRAPDPEPEEEEQKRPTRRRADEDDEEDRPRRRRREDEDDEEDRPRRRRRDDDEEDDDRQRRRRSRDDDEDDDDDDRPRRRGRRGAASAAAKGPGIALVVTGILGLLIGLFYVIQAIVGHPLLDPRAQQQAQEPVFLWAFALVSLIWGAVVTLGGVKFMQLNSRGSVMVACIFAMLPCNPCCLAGLPIGIWGLVVLARPDVKRAFR